MRRFLSGRRHRQVAVTPLPEDPIDDLATWSNAATIDTMSLPGSSVDIYPLVVDVTNVIVTAAKNDTNALRFRHENGVRMSHKRTPGNRILLIGNFHGGKNKIHYYWGKVGATQPGNGFQTADVALAEYRLGLIFESSAPLDISPNPATFSTVGTPTYEANPLGQSLRCADGSYIETTAAKLRSDSRAQRAVFSVITLPSATIGGRILCWANWLNNQRSFMLWMRTDGLELYVSDSGTSFQRWELLGYQRAGRNAIGANWKANTALSILLLNEVAEEVLPSFDGTPPGQLFSSTEPYIVGGTKVPGATFTGTIECQFELVNLFKSANHFTVWRLAWTENESFWGKEDRTPDSIDVPDLTNVPVSSEVTFSRKEVTGISPGTPISVLGDGAPTYSIGSSFSVPADLKAKGSTPGTVSSGNWISTYHTAAAQNSTVQESFVSVGTVTSPRRSTTVALTSGGGTSIPTGPANVTVNSLSALKTEFARMPGGQILEITAGDYKGQGGLDLSNRDFRGGPPLVVRASTIPYRGYLPSEGGLLVSGETYFTTGSGGAEFSTGFFRNIHNVVFQNIRFYTGNVGTAGAKWYALNCVSCSNITFENSKFCGYRPDYVDPVTEVDYSDEITWTPEYKADDPWRKQARAVQLGVSGGCDKISFKKCMFHYNGDIGFYNAQSPNTLLEDCMFTDQMSDHLRTDGGQDNFTARRCIFGRCWGIQGSPGGGLAHCDVVQNTTKTQPGWRKHIYDSCIMGPLDAVYPHIQALFYECDFPDDYPIGDGLNVTNCLIETRVRNAIVAYPGNRTIVTLTTILQNQFGGRTNRRDMTWHNPTILVNSNNRSRGNNKVDRTVYHSADLNTGAGDQYIASTQLHQGSYPTVLNDYPVYSSSLWRPVMFYNPYTGVINVNEIRRWSPKTNAAIHPNQKGVHHGATALLQSLGALL